MSLVWKRKAYGEEKTTHKIRIEKPAGPANSFYHHQPDDNFCHGDVISE
jgi:hypothetical protein